MCFFDVLFWMVESGTLVPHDLFLCLQNKHMTPFHHFPARNYWQQRPQHGNESMWRFGGRSVMGLWVPKQLKKPYMARVNVLDPQGASFLHTFITGMIGIVIRFVWMEGQLPLLSIMSWIRMG